jgi:hypothetical protein
MEDLRDKLQHVAVTRFPGSALELDRVAPDEKLSGFLLWEGFEPMEQLDRQRHLNGVLRNELTQDERGRISMIFTLTPEEAAVMREG